MVHCDKGRYSAAPRARARRPVVRHVVVVRDDNSRKMSWQDTASGVAGSVCCTGLGLPFDVAKARIQNAPGVYGGLIDCMAKAVRLEGPLSLYSGALPALGSACTENAVGMTVNRGMRRQVAAWQGQSLAEVHISPPMEVALGGVTGVFTSVAICPFEVLKVQQQVVLAEGGAAPSMMQLLRQLVRRRDLTLSLAS